MPPTKRAFLPALLLSLVLGAALLLRPAPPASSAGGAGGAVSGASEGPGLIVPFDLRDGGQHHPAAVVGKSVPEQLAARPDDVAFCVGSSLDPFDAAWAQLQVAGSGEIAERTRRCLMELVFTHVDPPTAEQVRAQLPRFGQCYQGALGLPDPEHRRVLTEITRCLTTLAARPEDMSRPPGR